MSKNHSHIPLVLYFIYTTIIILLSASVEIMPINTFVTTLPILIQIIFLTKLPESKKNQTIVWLLPIIFVGITYALSVNNQDIFKEIETNTIIVFNLIISYIITYLYFFLGSLFKIRREREKIIINTIKSQRKNKKIESTLKKNNTALKSHNKYYKTKINKLEEELARAQAELKITKDNFRYNLRGIEDKCKALNFAIGRVYSDKKGGNQEIRNVLKINREIYNTFSEITTNFSDKQLQKLTEILRQLYEQLALFEMKENRLFMPPAETKLPILRKPEGQSKIIDVLADNDKDPVREYYTEAKEVCERIVKFIQAEYDLL